MRKLSLEEIMFGLVEGRTYTIHTSPTSEYTSRFKQYSFRAAVKSLWIDFWSDTERLLAPQFQEDTDFACGKWWITTED
jgi:hypothetical protein